MVFQNKSVLSGFLKKIEIGKAISCKTEIFYGARFKWE
jgi:hypothetical protein